MTDNAFDDDRHIWRGEGIVHNALIGPDSGQSAQIIINYNIIINYYYTATCSAAILVFYPFQLFSYIF